MPFLMRVELPDVPGSLGALASALGSAGADIEAIQIVEHRPDGVAVDDVLLELPPQVMPDGLVTACHGLEGVQVQWISRYSAGANLSMDLEAVESFTEKPEHAVVRLVEVLPDTLRTDWAMAIQLAGPDVVVWHASAAAPEPVSELAVLSALRGPKAISEMSAWPETVLAASDSRTRDGRSFHVVVGRRGGPEFLGSEVARLGHLVSLASSVQS
jgi:hypothetical protein